MLREKISRPLQAPIMTQPRVSGVTRPVRQRHRSTAICRATATMAFFFAALVARTFFSTPDYFWTSRHSGCHTTSRQASSTSAVRSRALPCLVIES